MKLSKRQRDNLVKQWLRDPSGFQFGQDTKLNAHLPLGYRGPWKAELGSERCRLVEGGEVTLDVSSTSEISLVFERLIEALMQQDALVRRIRREMDKPRKAGAKRPNRIEVLILEVAADLLGRSKPPKANLAALVRAAVNRELRKRSAHDEWFANLLARQKDPADPPSIEHVRRVLKKAENAYPGVTVSEAVQQARRSLTQL